MALIPNAPIGPNFEKGIGAADEMSGDFFAVQGSGADGSINVNVVSGGGGGGDVNLTEVGGAPIALGQTTMSASLPVTIASDQSAIQTFSEGAVASAVPTYATYIGMTSNIAELIPFSAAANFGDASAMSGQIATGTYMYNGSTWDRMRGSISDGVLVNLGSNNDVAVSTQVGTANIATGQQALSTSSAQVAASRATRRSITIVNLSTIDIYIGNTGVTSATGQLLLGTIGTALTIETTVAIFAVAASGTPSVSYLEEYA